MNSKAGSTEHTHPTPLRDEQQPKQPLQICACLSKVSRGDAGGVGRIVVECDTGMGATISLTLAISVVQWMMMGVSPAWRVREWASRRPFPPLYLQGAGRAGQREMRTDLWILDEIDGGRWDESETLCVARSLAKSR